MLSRSYWFIQASSIVNFKGDTTRSDRKLSSL
nr:MAG TPA: hypothetical protein [Caudoviricetes sp.]